MPVTADAFLDEEKQSADSFLNEVPRQSADAFLDESDRPEERESDGLTPPTLEAEIPRPSVGATGYWGAGATGTWEDESGIPPEIGTEQTRRIRAGVDLLAARLQGDKEQREAESLGEQYRSIERFTPAGILNQPERIARAIAAPDAPEVPERFQPGQPIFPIPEPTGTNAMAGLGQLGVQTLNSLQTPEMIVTAPAAANPVGRALFAGDMGRHIPEQVEQGAQVIGDIETTPAQKVVAGGTPVIAGTMTALLGKSEIPRPVIVERTIAKTEAAVPGALSKSKAALEQSVVVKGDIPIPDRIGSIDKQLVELEKQYGPRMVWDKTNNRLVENPETIRPTQEDALIKLRDELTAQQPASTPAPTTTKIRPPLLRGTTLEQWQAIQRGEQPQSEYTTRGNTWATTKPDSARGYATGDNGVIIEYKDAAHEKVSKLTDDPADHRRQGPLRLVDIQRVTDKKGNIIYEAPIEKGIQNAKTETAVEAQPKTQAEAPAVPREPTRGEGGEESPVLLADRVAAMPPEEFASATRSEFKEGGFTTHALNMGREMATPDGIAKLRELEAKAKGEFDAAMAAENIDVLGALSAQKQFFTEALEAATGAAEFKLSDPAKFQELMGNETARVTEATPAAANQTPIPAGQAPVVEPRVGGVSQDVPGERQDAARRRVEPLAEPLPEPAGPKAKAGGELPTASQAVPETLTAAAIRAEDGTIYTGKWHPAAYEELMRDKGLTKDQAIQQQQEGKVADGFLTSSGRFVGREEAAKIASRADQFRPDKEGDIAFAGALKQKTLEAGPGKIAVKAQPELLGVETETQGAIATMGPPLMPTPLAGALAAPVTPISQIIRDLAKGLDLPIRFGRLTTGKYAGYFKKNPNLIGAKLANDMPIVAHEVGHKLDTIYPFTRDASILPELEALGDPAIAGSRSSWTPSKSGVYKRGEGLAEFVRHWLTDPAQAQKLAPNTHTLFERVLAANEDLSGTMRQAQSDIQLWKNAPQEGRLDSSLSRSDPNKSRYRFPNLLRDVVDDLHFLRMAVDDAKVSGNLPPSQNPYQLARTLRGSFGMADTFIRKGITDFKTKEVRQGTGLEDALKPISDRMDEFRRWIVAKRAQELRGQGKETGLNAGDVNFVANKYNSEPAFQEAFTKVKAWNDGLLQYAVDSGLIDAGKAATATEPATGAYAMRALHQDYVPFHRLFEVGAGEAPAVAGGGAGRGLNAGKPGSLKRLTGSQRDIVDPLETMVKNAYTMITAAEKNAINTAVADLAPKSDMGRWVERVAAPKELVKVELERIRKQLEDAGADLTGVPDDLLMGFFKPSGRAPFGENIIKVNRAGKQEFYRLDKELFDTFNALDQDASSRLLKLMSAPAQLLRAGVTLTPDFALSNAFRDTIGAAVLSKYTTYPFQATVRGIGAMLNDPKLVSEWAASGGKQSVEANYFDRAKLQKFLTEKITKDLTPAEQALVVAKSPLTALRMITGTLEEATRIGEYKAALKKLTDEGMPIGDARRQAAFEARDLQDFAKGGAQTKIVRSLAAFWNAGLQGNVRLAQSFKQRPFQTTLKGLAFITLPKLLEQALNWNDEDYWDRPQWERDLFFMIPRGKDENGHTQFIRLPTPFEMGVIFGTVPGRILQAIREKTPKSLESLPGVMLRQSAPNPAPQSVLTLLEVNAGKSGYSFFRDRPIVPSSLQNAPPELQFTSQNSLTAKKVGRLLGVSPAKVDYAIAGLTGGVGKQLTHQVSDRAISAATGEERTAQSTMPGARFIATPAGVQSESVDRFYKALEEANADAARVKAGEISQGQAKRAPRLNVIARRITDLRKQAREEQNPQARQRINLRIAEIAKQAITP